MRLFVRQVLLVPGLLALASCESTKSYPVKGSVAVSGVGQSERVLIVAQTFDGRRVGEGVATGAGGFELSLNVPSGTSRVLLTAVYPQDPERRSFAIIDLPEKAGSFLGGLRQGQTPQAQAPREQSSQGQTRRALSAKGDDPAATGSGSDVPFVALDSRSSATALVMTTSKNLTAPIAKVEQAFGPQISKASHGLGSFSFPTCSVEPTKLSDPGAEEVAQALNEVEKLAAEHGVPELIQKMLGVASSGGDAVERLIQMQKLITQFVWSINNKQLPAYINSPVGFIPLALLRIATWAFTREGANEIDETAINQGQLAQMAGMIAGAGWGNCREKAYMGAFAASLVKDFKQVSIIGVDLKNGGSHAVAVACLDGPEVYNLANFGKKGETYPEGAARCYVIDPWAGPESDPTAGHVQALDAAYVKTWGWAVVTTNKPVSNLDGGTRFLRHRRLICTPGERGYALRPGSKFQVTCGDEERDSCSPFSLPAADAGARPDGGLPPPPPADAAPPKPDAQQCPPPSGNINGMCAGHGGCPPEGGPCPCPPGGEFCCPDGFCWSRGTVACEQISCPEGSGRTYTEECCCNCWDDQSKVNVYDPCRPGYLLRCDPRQ